MGSESRKQTRATCSICGNDHVAKGGKMVAHGYNIAHGFQSDHCIGAFNVHYGHKDAPEFIKSVIESLKEQEMTAGEKLNRLKASHSQLMKSSPNRLDAIESTKALNHQRNYLSQIETMIVYLLMRLKRQSLAKPYTVDVEKLAAEERQARMDKAEEKAAEKKRLDDEKSARIAERERKAIEKHKLLLSNQWRSITLCGELVAEWQQEYSSERELMDHFRDLVKAELVKKCLSGDLTLEQCQHGSYELRLVSRTGKIGAKGRQLAKFAYGLNYDLYDHPELVEVKKQELARNAFYISEIEDGQVIDKYSENNVPYHVMSVVVGQNRKSDTSTIVVTNYQGEEMARKVASSDWVGLAQWNGITSLL